MNESINLSGLFQGGEVLSISDLALNFCNNLYSYLLTILIFVLFYIIYRQELKQYVIMLINWFNTSVSDEKLKKYLSDIPQDIEWALGYLSLSGVFLIIMFYKDYLQLNQKIFIGIVICILVLHRCIDIFSWLGKKIILYYAKKQLGNITKEMEYIIKEDKK